MRVVFFGTPDFAVPTLDALLRHGVDVAAVVTQPDRPGARSHSSMVAPPVKQRALAAGLAVLQPDRPRGDEFLDHLRSLEPDLGVVVAYGHILRPELLAIPRLGMVNVHGSLLPRWRGAAPIHWAVMAGDSTTGVSIMKLDHGLDSGPVWLRRDVPVGTSSSGELYVSLARLGADALIEALPLIEGGIEPTPQDETAVTVAPKVTRQMARIDWNTPCIEIKRKVQGMDPRPGAWTMLDGTPVRILQASCTDVPADAPPGTPRHALGTLQIATADSWLNVARLQQAGRPLMDSDAWIRGLREELGGLRFE